MTLEQRQIHYWAHMLDESFSSKHAYLQSVSPKKNDNDKINGIHLIDDNGKRIDDLFDFQFDYNCNKAGIIGLRGWSVIDKNEARALTDFDSGHGPHDISLLLLASFLRGHGYELVDER